MTKVIPSYIHTNFGPCTLIDYQKVEGKCIHVAVCWHNITITQLQLMTSCRGDSLEKHPCATLSSQVTSPVLVNAIVEIATFLMPQLNSEHCAMCAQSDIVRIRCIGHLFILVCAFYWRKKSITNSRLWVIITTLCRTSINTYFCD